MFSVDAATGEKLWELNVTDVLINLPGAPEYNATRGELQSSCAMTCCSRFRTCRCCQSVP